MDKQGGGKTQRFATVADGHRLTDSILSIGLQVSFAHTPYTLYPLVCTFSTSGSVKPVERGTLVVSYSSRALCAIRIYINISISAPAVGNEVI